jgi:hypothetical protein
MQELREEEIYLLLILGLGTRWGERPASRSGRALPLVPTGYEAGWTSELVWTQRLEEKSFASAEDRVPVIQSVVRLSYPSSCFV